MLSASVFPKGVPVFSCFSRVLRSASGSDSGFFLLRLRVCEILCMPFKNSLCFVQLSGFPIHKPHWPSKPDVWGLIFPMQDPQARESNMGSDPLPLEENLYICDNSPICMLPTKVCGSVLPYLYPSFLFLCGSFFMYLVVDSLFC